ADFLDGRRTRHAEYEVCVRFVAHRLTRYRAARSVPGNLIQAESLMRARQEVEFAAVHRPIGPRNHEQCCEHILQNAMIVGEYVGELRGIWLKAVGAVTCLVEQAANVTQRRGRDAALTPER